MSRSHFSLLQVTVKAITNSSIAGVYKITPQDDFWDAFVDARQNATQLGNLISFEADYINGGINTNGNNVCSAHQANNIGGFSFKQSHKVFALEVLPVSQAL